jgi:hypothetical protein
MAQLKRRKNPSSPSEDTVEVAYFFFVLPEPLRLPHHHIIESVMPPALQEVREALEAATGGEMNPLEPRTVASLRVWQTSVPSHLVVDHESAGVFEVMREAFPSVPETSTTPTESGELPRTIVEAAVALDPASEDPTSDAFDKALEAVQALQHAYRLTTREQVTLLTQENAPFAVPMALRRISPEQDEWPEGFTLFLVNVNVRSSTLGESLSDREIEAVNIALEGRFHPLFAAYAELRWEARHALHFRGDYRASFVLTYSASETFLNALLMHMLWEEDTDPEEAAQRFFANQTLRERLRRHYHDRLGGNWSLTGTNPLGRWARELAPVRHRVIHAAYKPTRGEAYNADACFTELEEFVITRLSTLQILARYPRTAMGLLGRATLETRGAWSGRLEELTQEPEEPAWIETFDRWRWVLADALTDTNHEPATDPEELAAVLVLRHDAPPQWYEHDRRRRRVRATHLPADLTPAAAARMHESEQEFLAATEPGHRGTIFWPGRPGAPLPDAPWVREHTVLPLHGVRLAPSSDFRD